MALSVDSANISNVVYQGYLMLSYWAAGLYSFVMFCSVLFCEMTLFPTGSPCLCWWRPVYNAAGDYVYITIIHRIHSSYKHCTVPNSEQGWLSLCLFIHRISTFRWNGVYSVICTGLTPLWDTDTIYFEMKEKVHAPIYKFKIFPPLNRDV